MNWPAYSKFCFPYCPMPHPTQRRNMHARRGSLRSDRSMVPKLPEITKNSLARAQRSVHRINATPLPLANCRDSKQLEHPSETMDANTHVGYSRTWFLWEQQGREREVLPAIATSTQYQRRHHIGHSTVLPDWFEMTMRRSRTAFSR